MSAALALLVTGPACKKESKALDWDRAARSEAVVAHNRDAAAALVAPPLFASIPADTPYVFASFEPIPPEYWHRTFAQIGPAVQRLLARVAGGDAGGPSSAARAVSSELRGDLSAAGLERLGLSASPRFALYGLGPMPVVRVEIADAARLTATIERLGARLGAAFERREHGGTPYWIVDEPKRTIAVAVIDAQLVVTWGNAAAVDRVLPVLFGDEPLGPTMADGRALAELAARHGLSGYGLGYLDVGRLTALATGGGSGIHADVAATYAGTAARSTPACRDALSSVAAEMPRVVIGYDELSPDEASMTAVMEVSESLARRVQAVARDVPGLTARFPARPLVAIGAGFDADAATALISSLRAEGGRIAGACGVEGRLAPDSALLAGELFDPPDGIRGGMLVIQRAQLSEFGLPTGIEGYAVIAVDDARARLAGMTDISEQLASVKADGSFRRISLGRFERFFGSLHVAVRGDAILIAVGDRSKVRLERALDGEQGSPLFVMAYDAAQFSRLTGSLLDLTSMLSGRGTPVDTATPHDGPLGIGQIALSVQLTAAGIEVHGRVGSSR